MKLSEARTTRARDWFAAHAVLPVATPIRGYGKTVPIPPNTTSDGKDGPDGGQKNRRVAAVLATCT